MTAPAIVLDPLMSDVDAAGMVDICERFDSYGLYVTETSQTEFAPELAQRIDAALNYVRTGGRFAREEPARTLALRTNYLRESYAYGDDVYIDGIERFRDHGSLIDAARELHGRPVIEPSIAYANILLPGQELAVHTDVPEFRGANRKLVPQWLLVVMRHSGLFERWRMPIATGISYFSPDGQQAAGGELAYYPDGREGPVEVFAPQHNTAVMIDADSVFHGVDRVGPPDTEPFPVEPGNVLAFRDGSWVLHPSGEDRTVLQEYSWADIRFSVSWKAYCFADEEERRTWRDHADDLTMEYIIDTLEHDLRRRGALQGERPPDRELAMLLIRTYVHFPEPQA